MSELTLRVIVSVVAAPLALWIVLAGGAPLAALLAVVCALGAWEFYRIARASGARPLDDVGIVLAGLTPLAIHAHYLGVVTVRPPVVALVVVVMLGATIWLRGVDGHPLGAAATTILGVVYTAGLLGFAYANWFKPRAAYRFSAENSIYLHRNASGKGLGKLLLAELLMQLERLGIRKVMAVIGGSENLASIGLHKSLGFTSAGLIEGAGWKQDRWLDLVLMQRALSAGTSQPPV